MATGAAPSLGKKKGPFIAPVRQILNPMDMDSWERSDAYANLMGFILAVNEACVGVSLSDLDAAPRAPGIVALHALIARLDALVDATPPVQQPMRFGNAAFVTWLHAMAAEAPALVASVLPPELADAAVELTPYLTGGFGNEQRRDYGTGHELSFVAFIGGLALTGAIDESSYSVLGLDVFGRAYMALVRKLQTVYSLEPAGSHGAFGLDDYQFVPFIWGSAQLVGHAHIKPTSVLEHEVLTLYEREYLYLACVSFVNKIKTGPFEEHSACLYSITGVAHWRKINEGMVKMFRGEVLRKFPVVQHFLFGSLYNYVRPGGAVAGARPAWGPGVGAPGGLPDARAR